MKVALLTREYPPEVYGGAGVHVEYLSRALADKGVPHQFAVWPGEAHRGRYWREMVPHYL